jgi:hypothetical protein
MSHQSLKGRFFMSGRSWWTKCNYGSTIVTVQKLRKPVLEEYVQSIGMNGRTEPEYVRLIGVDKGTEESMPGVSV